MGGDKSIEVVRGDAVAVGNSLSPALRALCKPLCTKRYPSVLYAGGVPEAQLLPQQKINTLATKLPHCLMARSALDLFPDTTLTRVRKSAHWVDSRWERRRLPITGRPCSFELWHIRGNRTTRVFVMPQRAHTPTCAWPLEIPCTTIKESSAKSC